ncbi:MAG TPA: hypothetical protein VK689_20375 [Armatimonadota bacterium]|jgi:hypothetical protein|nr:hypothetical protein [Armatimonadota bacterium]
MTDLELAELLNTEMVAIRKQAALPEADAARLRSYIEGGLKPEMLWELLAALYGYGLAARLDFENEDVDEDIEGARKAWLEWMADRFCDEVNR